MDGTWTELFCFLIAFAIILRSYLLSNRFVLGWFNGRNMNRTILFSYCLCNHSEVVFDSILSWFNWWNMNRTILFSYCVCNHSEIVFDPVNLSPHQPRVRHQLDQPLLLPLLGDLNLQPLPKRFLKNNNVWKGDQVRWG
jgi:hypothetical protein